MSASLKGRGAAFNPPNRFEQLHLEPLEIEWDENDEDRPVQTVFYKDTSKTILAKNDSPDIPFTYSINPYRGCEHGCIYCYARPSHEYLGFSAGIDFETKIIVKHDAPALLEKEFRKKTWQPQMVCFSGNTDCYQPVERKVQLTRRCLEVFLKYRNPVGLITKNALIVRDLDILKDLAARDLVFVIISITSFNKELIRMMEPRTSAPYKRLETIEILSSHGIPVCVNVAPIIPGLTDEEMPMILKEAASRGATWAGYTMLRLPGSVEPLFLDWIQRTLPERAGKVLNRIRDVRSGKLSDSQWGKRMGGEGEIANSIKQLFKLSCEKVGLNNEKFEFDTSHFRREPKGQMEMF
ncbi:MAG: PA0069 family radical SAM protein [Ignavibacteria bacterium]|nr:PA0069 family radical SAM protein [Ignavibacteria bacterium]MBI3765407.1 PA0069 family radical SAM protein [Ignavibacteriales bacterium]